MLQNAYFLAKIGADTAENEQHFAEIWASMCAWRPLRSVPGLPGVRRREDREHREGPADRLEQARELQVPARRGRAPDLRASAAFFRDRSCKICKI